MAISKEKSVEMADHIKERAIRKINSFGDAEINMRVIGLGETKFSPEASISVMLTDFAAFIKNVEHFMENQYGDVKQAAINSVIPLFSKKALEVKKKDISNFSVEEKRQILIDNVNKQTFSLCEDNAKRDGKRYDPENPIEASTAGVRLTNYLDNETSCISDGLLDSGNQYKLKKKISEKLALETTKGRGTWREEQDQDNKDYEDFVNGTGIYAKILKDVVPGTVLVDPPSGKKDMLKISKGSVQQKESVVVKNDFVFEGTKTCTIRFIESKNQPKLARPEKYIYSLGPIYTRKNNQWLLSTQELAILEVGALRICFRKNNKKYKLDRKALQDAINGNMNKKSQDAIKIVKRK